MESLHLSYREVVYEIPYRNLLLMQSDKARVLMDDEYIVNRLSGRDFMNRRMQQ